jgi:hypothetical protein
MKFDEEVSEGDLKGARYRWELAQKGADRTVVTLRAKQDLSASSLALRALFAQEPLFETGFAAALSMTTLDGVRARAEGRR